MSPIEFTRVVDEEGLVRWHDVLRRSLAADFDALPADPLSDIRPGLSGSLTGDAIEFWLGVADRPAVAVTIRCPVHDNRDLANVGIHVHPNQRRRGYGRAASEAAFARLRELGRARVLGEVPAYTKSDDPSPAVYLARSLGARPMLAERRRLLDVAALDLARLAALRDGAARAGPDYSMVTWADTTPAELVEEMAGLLALMSTDPPQGELDLEPEIWNADRYHERERSVIERRRRHLVVAARHEPTGRLAGFTDLGVPSGDGVVGYQWSTIVQSEHRGHRLGLLMKVVNLQRMLVAFPGVRNLNTWNADENAHMVAVNEALGFRTMEGWAEWQLEL